MMGTLLIALLGALLLTTQAPEAGTLEKRFVGSWRVITAEGRSTDGKVTLD